MDQADSQSVPVSNSAPQPGAIDPQIEAAHERLAVQTMVVSHVGRLMMSAGAGAYRTKVSMARVAASLGIERLHVQLSMNEMIVTAYANHTFRTSVNDQRVIGVNADRLEVLNNLVANLEPKTRAEDLEKELHRIEHTPARYGWFLNAFASGFACAGFAFLNQGGAVECFSVLIGAFAGQFLRRQMLHRHMNHFAVWLACGFVAASLYVAVATLLANLGFASHFHQAGFISSILFLIPGFPMVTAMLDLVRGDFLSGLSRGAYTAMVMTSAAVSVWVVSFLYAWPVEVDYEVSLSWWLMLGLRIISSFAAAFGFAMLFNSPAQLCLISACIAAAANPARIYLATEINLPGPLAVGLASLVVGLVVALITRYVKASRVSLSVPAVVIMIPGVPLYRSVTALNPTDASPFVVDSVDLGVLPPLFAVLFTIAAIGIGQALARVLTDRKWAFESPTHSTPDLRNDEDPHPAR